MAIKHTKTAIPDVDKVDCIDWNADHVVDGNTGEVLFLTAGGNVDTDPIFFWDDVNKRLGIGTATPAKKLEIYNSDWSKDVALRLHDTGLAAQFTDIDLIAISGEALGASSEFRIDIKGNPLLTLTEAGIIDPVILEVNGKIKDQHGYVVPAGTITMYGGAVAPTGWVLCDGAEYFVIGTYNDLAQVIGTTFGEPEPGKFNVPDMRGIFPRGAGAQTIGAQTFTGVLGTTTGDSTALPNTDFTTNSFDYGTKGSGNPSANHQHYQGHDWGGNKAGGGSTGLGTGNYLTGTVTAWHTHTTTIGAHSHTITGGGDTETAPANLGLTYIIKY